MSWLHAFSNCKEFTANVILRLFRISVSLPNICYGNVSKHRGIVPLKTQSHHRCYLWFSQKGTTCAPDSCPKIF